MFYGVVRQLLGQDPNSESSNTPPHTYHHTGVLLKCRPIPTSAGSCTQGGRTKIFTHRLADSPIKEAGRGDGGRGMRDEAWCLCIATAPPVSFTSPPAPCRASSWKIGIGNYDCFFYYRRN